MVSGARVARPSWFRPYKRFRGDRFPLGRAQDRLGRDRPIDPRGKPVTCQKQLVEIGVASVGQYVELVRPLTHHERTSRCAALRAITRELSGRVRSVSTSFSRSVRLFSPSREAAIAWPSSMLSRSMLVRGRGTDPVN